MSINGTIDVAPIPVQYQDERAGIQREYLSVRAFCPRCMALFDFELVNRIKQPPQDAE
jgi:hypothetical protein